MYASIFFHGVDGDPEIYLTAEYAKKTQSDAKNYRVLEPPLIKYRTQERGNKNYRKE